MALETKAHDQAIADEAADKALVDTALRMASRLLQEHFSGRIISAGADIGLRQGLYVPVIIRAEVPEAQFYDFQKELADTVFAQISMDTGVDMPIYIISSSSRCEMTGDSIASLYGSFEP